MPLLALSSGDRYVAAAYLVFLFLVLSYLAIMAVKLARIEREVVEISEIVERRSASAEAAPARSKEPVG
jgi:type II secretory pathway component PulM